MILERVVRISEILRSPSDGSARACLGEAVRVLTSGNGALSELLGAGVPLRGAKVDHVGFVLPASLEQEFAGEAFRSGLSTRSYPSSVACLEFGRPARVVEASGASSLLVEAIIPEGDEAVSRGMAEAGRAAHVALRLRGEPELREAVALLGDLGFRAPDFMRGASPYSDGADMTVVYLDGTVKAGRLRVELCVRTVRE